MAAENERILVVEADPDTSDLIARQVLEPLGYRVRVVEDATRAIHEAIRFSPDVVLANLNLPGLSGKDLLVALSSQGLETPVLVIAEPGQEGDVIQAFRLGASDYLRAPVREAEVVAAVERALGNARSRREREQLSQKLEKTNRELNRRLRELTTIFGVGKAVTSITDPRLLFDKLVAGGVFVTAADKGWLLLRQDESKTYTLRACANMPAAISAKIGQPWDDGLGSLVALSGESLSIHGTALKRFKVARLGQAALVVPVKAQKEVLGLLVVVREAEKAFDANNQALLEAIADYASIALMNIRLFHAVEQRAHSLQKAVEGSKEGDQIKTDLYQNLAEGLRTPLTAMGHQLDLLGENLDRMRADHQESVRLLQKNLDHLKQFVAALDILQQASASPARVRVNLTELIQEAVGRFETPARQNAVRLLLDVPPTPLWGMADPGQVAQLFDALLSNAIRYSAGGRVTFQVAISKKGVFHGIVKDTGPGIALEHQAQIFQPFYQVSTTTVYAHDGLGLGLAIAREVTRAHGGDIWVKSEPGKGTAFNFTLAV